LRLRFNLSLHGKKNKCESSNSYQNGKKDLYRGKTENVRGFSKHTLKKERVIFILEKDGNN